MDRRQLLPFFIAACLLVGCRKRPPAGSGGNEPAAASESSAAQEADDLLASRCAPCHGREGRGDGPAAAALNPHPADFHNAAWQARTSDTQIEQIIRAGGAAVGKSAAMPPNPDLLDRPDVVAALRARIRAWGH